MRTMNSLLERVNIWGNSDGGEVLLFRINLFVTRILVALHELIYKHTHTSAHTYTYIYRQFFTTVYFQRIQTFCESCLKKKIYVVNILTLIYRGKTQIKCTFVRWLYYYLRSEEKINILPRFCLLLLRLRKRHFYAFYGNDVTNLFAYAHFLSGKMRR